MKEITLTFNGTSTKLVSDNEEMFNLNKIHTASGEPERRKPSFWYRSAEVKRMVENLEVQNCTSKIKSVRGRGITGTWGIEQVVYAYASWISPE